MTRAKQRSRSNVFSQMNFVIAADFKNRMRGLLGTDDSWGNGGFVLVLVKCRSVHTFGMRYALDIAFADKQGFVLLSKRSVKPGRLICCPRATFALECPHDRSSAWFHPGERLPLSLDRHIAPQHRR